MSDPICYSDPFTAYPQKQASTGKHPGKHLGLPARARLRTVLRGSAGAAALGVALVLACSPAAARYRHWHGASWHGASWHGASWHGASWDGAHRHGAAAPVAKDPFAAMPPGPLQVFVSINQQQLQLYSDGQHVTNVPVATGVPDHPTPMGVFDVIQRDRYHLSNIYSDAPMPYMQRITWSGVALHEGPNVGHAASHGCIRMPHYFAAQLWRLQTMGMRVVVSRAALRPTEIADPHLFVHKDNPAPAAPLTAQVAVAQTTRTKTDAGQLGSGAIGAAAAPDRPADGQVATPANAAAQPGEASAPAAAAVAATMTAPIALDDLPLPPAKPVQLVRSEHAPVAIFVSRKLGKIFVRQNFAPLFQAPVKIDNPDVPLGTHVFTALNYEPDNATLTWNVVSLPDQPTVRWKYVTTASGWRKRVRVTTGPATATPPETPQQALARITIPPDVTARISQLIDPGSSLVISDQGLGEETGKGTDFIVVQH